MAAFTTSSANSGIAGLRRSACTIRSRPSLETLVQLSLAFDIDFWTLVSESGLMPKDAPENPKASRQPHPLEMIPRKKVEDLTFDELELVSEFIDFVKWRRKTRGDGQRSRLVRVAEVPRPLQAHDGHAMAVRGGITRISRGSSRPRVLGRPGQPGSPLAASCLPRAGRSTSLGAAIVAVMLLAACTGPFGAGSGIHIQNIDGPKVRIVAWSGAPSIMVDCGSGTEVSLNGAPSPPWDFRIYDATTDRELFSKSVSSGTLYVIVRADGVLWGSEPGSGGPAPTAGCH